MPHWQSNCSEILTWCHFLATCILPTTLEWRCHLPREKRYWLPQGLDTVYFWSILIKLQHQILSFWDCSLVSFGHFFRNDVTFCDPITSKSLWHQFCQKLDMNKRLKKNFTLIAFLLLVNVVGFLSAQAYFSSAKGTSVLNTQVLLESVSFNPKMVAPSKWLELTIDLLRKNR